MIWSGQGRAAALPDLPNMCANGAEVFKMFDDQKFFESCSSPFLAVWQDAKSIGLHHEIGFMLSQCAVRIANGAQVAE